MSLHPLLARQLRRLLLDPSTAPPADGWAQLLEGVSRAYSEADRDRYTLERSIEISGTEMRELYAQLARDHEALQNKRQHIQAIFDHGTIGLAVVDETGAFAQANGALASMLGCSIEELIGRGLLDLADAAERERFAPPLRELLQGERRELAAEQHWQTATGLTLWVHLALSLVESSGSQPRLVSLFIENVTQRKLLEIELRHAQKLESMGRLAAGIAHEINTPVQFIGDNLPFLQEAEEANRCLRLCFRELLARALAGGRVDLAEITDAERTADVAYLDEEVPRALAQTRDGVLRVATIVRAMKEFAHPDTREQAKADLNGALASTITVAGSEFNGVAEVHTEFGEIPPVMCNRGDLNQVFLNLLVNASHAIADVVGSSGKLGRIVVRTARDGDHVVIAISDTGGGIPEHVQPHIFEPFFTTKVVGQGTGQGLAMSRAVVVDRHRGQLTFRTRPGEGTTFEIRIPIDVSDADRRIADEEANALHAALRRSASAVLPAPQ